MKKLTSIILVCLLIIGVRVALNSLRRSLATTTLSALLLSAVFSSFIHLAQYSDQAIVARLGLRVQDSFHGNEAHAGIAERYSVLVQINPWARAGIGEVLMDNRV